MICKIKKYIKFVVCITLIFGLMAPSYAALSASDGSAFITKAEFDSALADFNVRLTTFEAGINSKIDSQVSSYLDRNGIWNGKDQTLLTTFSDSDAGLTYKAVNKGGITKYFQKAKDGLYYVYGSKMNDAGANDVELKDGSFTNRKVIDKINKTGLLFLYYDTYTQKFFGANATNDTLMICGNANGYLDSGWYEGFIVLCDIAYWYAQEENVGLNKCLASHTFQVTELEKPLFNNSSYINLVEVFVTKDQPLYLNKSVTGNLKNVCWKTADTTAEPQGQYFYSIEYTKANVY